MEESLEYRQQLLQEYKQAALPLLRYLPWLEKAVGTKASSVYDGQDIGAHSMTFPVYDSTLLNFVKEAAKSPLMDRNYRYVYTRNHINSHEDEKRIIQKAGWKDCLLHIGGKNQSYALESGGAGRNLLSCPEADEGNYRILGQAPGLSIEGKWEWERSRYKRKNTFWKRPEKYLWKKASKR